MHFGPRRLTAARLRASIRQVRGQQRGAPSRALCQLQAHRLAEGASSNLEFWSCYFEPF